MYKLHKLSIILTTMEDCLSKLDGFNSAYKQVESTEIKLYMEEGFKSYISNFQQEVVNYLATTRKGLYSRKDELKYVDILKKHKIAGLLGDVSVEFLNNLREERNVFAHKYEQPDFQAMYEFFTRNRDEFVNMIECVNEIRENQRIRDREKNSNKLNKPTETDLYNAIEIARNLLDVLDDKTIAIKTGLNIDIIKSLRNG